MFSYTLISWYICGLCMVPYTICYTVYIHSCVNVCVCERALYKLISKSGSFNEAFGVVALLCASFAPFARLLLKSFAIALALTMGMHSFIHCASIALNGPLIPFASSLYPSTFDMRSSLHAHDNRFACMAFSVCVRAFSVQLPGNKARNGKMQCMHELRGRLGGMRNLQLIH